MKLRNTYYSDYIDFVFNSFTDYCVFSDMLEYYLSLDFEYDKYVKLGINLSSLADQKNFSSISVILYAALSIEAYTNLIGSYLFPEMLAHEKEEKLSTRKKLKEVLVHVTKDNKEYCLGNRLFQDIDGLFKERDELVHDKGYIVEPEEFIKEFSVKRKRKKPIDIIRLLLTLDSTIKDDQRLKMADRLIRDEQRRCYEDWIGKEHITIHEGDPYAHARFPDESEYKKFIQRHLGAGSSGQDKQEGA